MSDDQPTRDEAAVSFSERVTAYTLADRPSIPSFDTSAEEWLPKTALRLEGEFTDVQGDDSLQTRAPMIIIIGPYGVPYNESGPREVFVYDKSSGQRVPLDGYYLDDDIGQIGGDKDSSVIRPGEGIKLSLGREFNPQRTVATKLEIAVIKSGPLA